MSPVIKNVALAGATGTLGSIVLTALINSSKFNITVIARKENQSLPSTVSVKVVDTGSITSIASALQGQDAFIDATSGVDPTLSPRLIDAAVVAGVYRFIASEYSADPQNAEARSPLIFHGKNAVFQQLQKLAAEGKITYSTISNCAFLDWNLRTGFINIDIFNKKVTYMNDGALPFPWTMLSSISNAVVNVLLKPAETENRCLYISSIVKSQRQMVELAKEALGAEGWEEKNQNMDKALKDATENMMRGEVDMQVIGDMIRWSAGTTHSHRWTQKEDNDLLGVKSLSDDDVRKLIKEIAAEKK